MRWLPSSLSLVVTCAAVYALNRSWGPLPPLGAFISPQQGFWQNAESVKQNRSASFAIPGLGSTVEVFLDDRMVPHIFSDNEEDAIYVQGYLHAQFRLWQMEFQTHAAAGRLSEILGEGEQGRILNYDRQMRRVGMVYGAQRALDEIEKDEETSQIAKAYTAGVNAYIDQLSAATLPFEYKLLGYYPEHWTTLKSALFLKYMSYDLSGGENDFEMTHARSVLTPVLFDLLYPVTQDSLDPVVARETVFDSPTVHLQVPKLADSLFLSSATTDSILEDKPDPDNGSNNWAVSGVKTQSGRPILCNDPHLELNLPSIWFEMQIQTPAYNVYGASFPGAPNVMIGFNDSCAFGFTNAMRDVKDYYEITFKDETRQEYWFNGQWTPTLLQVDTFRVKGKAVYYDTVAYTVFGPVMYDASYRGLAVQRTDGKNYAVRWKAHDPSNELKFFNRLNRARNYDEYYDALQYLTCPGQNCLFAAKSGTIAIWQQAEFPAKWKRQGDFVMPGKDSTFLWQGYIPRNENPHMVNPERGFVSSANQLPVDTSYPYYIGGHHDLYRGKIINRYLSGMTGITIDQMKSLQTDNYNLLAEMALPVLLHNLDQSQLDAEQKRLLEIVIAWSRRNDPGEKGVAVFNSWYDSLKSEVWSDDFSAIPKPWLWPDDYTLIEGLLRDSVYRLVDNLLTPGEENLQQAVTAAFIKAAPGLLLADQENRLSWSQYKDAGIRHLLRLPVFSRFHLTTGGGTHVINATKKHHGPSWRMIVQLTDETEAYGIYPGGQSGNPGSPYYDSFVDDWAAGQYYSLWVMKPQEKNDSRIRAVMTFHP